MDDQLVEMETSESIVEPNESEKVEKDPLTILDLNDDCLETIFKLLPAEDLICVAEADPQFEAVAKQVYKLNYQWKHNIGILWLSLNKRNDRRNLWHIRHFGDLYDSVHLSIDLKKANFRLLDEIVKHCGKLTELTLVFSGATGRSRMNGKKYCRVFLERLSTNFPNIENLCYRFHSIGYFKRLDHILQTFPHLTRLDIDVDEKSLESFKQFIRMHPGILNLTIDFKMMRVRQEMITSINDCLPHLRTLSFSCNSVELIETYRPINFKSLVTLKINCWSYTYNTTDILNVLAVDGRNIHTFYDLSTTPSPSAMDIICRFTQLQDVYLKEVHDDDLVRMANNLPLIKKLKISNSFLTAPAMLFAMDGWLHLKSAYIKYNIVGANRLDMVAALTDMSAALKESEWHFSVSTDFVFSPESVGVSIYRKTQLIK